ncbi:hypothetical protein [Actinoplanes sp. NPDC051494]|uniref:hypothetical protein n=1 Tax=Actinoplanes sp. NPDC051494 TaxID=3363907 RepID=UPI0037B4EDB0
MIKHLRATIARNLAGLGDEARIATHETAEKIEALRADEKISDRYRDDQIQQLREDLTQRLDEIRAEADGDRDRLLAEAGKLDLPQGDAAAQLLAETRQGKAWNRVRAQLDAGRGHHEIFAEAVTRGDRDMILAMRAELPSFLESQQKRPGGIANRMIEPLELGQLRHALDLGLAKALGDDDGVGTAARLRLTATTQHAVAAGQVELGQKGRGNLPAAFAATTALRTAERTMQELGDTAEPDAV